jgi:hypothetical protein
MKFTKMSLVAALLIGSSAFAIENVKVSGDAKLFYATDDATADGIQSVAGHGNANPNEDNSLFSAGSSAGQAALGLGITADLAKGISGGAHLTVLSTLGLEGQLVNNVWEGTNGTTDSYIVDQAWLAATVGKTTAKIGRMELDTPLTFTEKWSIAENTFEAAVLINQDIPDTTLIAAYVGGSNSNSAVNNAGHGTGSPALGGTQLGAGANGLIQNQAGTNNSTFSQYYNGAFAVAAINNSFKPLTVQAWYYDAPQFLSAYWLQADLGMQGILAGVQYTKTSWVQSANLNLGGADDNNDAVAVMLGYDGMKDIGTIKVAYSSTGTDTTGLGAGANIATYSATANGHSKLYTEAWWNYGYVTRADTNAWNVTVESPVNGLFDLGLYYTSTTTSNNNVANTPDLKMSEFTATASKTVGPLDATLAYIYTNADDLNQPVGGGARSGQSFNTIQAYLTLNF